MLAVSKEGSILIRLLSSLLPLCTPQVTAGSKLKAAVTHSRACQPAPDEAIRRRCTRAMNRRTNLHPALQHPAPDWQLEGGTDASVNAGGTCHYHGSHGTPKRLQSEFLLGMGSSVNAGSTHQYHGSNRTPETGERLHSSIPCWAIVSMQGAPASTAGAIGHPSLARGCTV